MRWVLFGSMLCRAVLSWQQPIARMLPHYARPINAGHGDSSSLQRLFVKPALRPGTRVALGPEQSHYLLSVLRLRPSACVRVFNGIDGEFLAALDEDDESEVVASKGKRTAKKKAVLIVLPDEPCLRPQPPPDRAGEAHLVFAVIKV